ncbi:MAG: hypothetical protein HY581_08810, partial [Nitrospirae bacterium]|nr:hypothetical protein [Nitrospirota bacterium]
FTPVATAAEFFSWIDASGTMVITVDTSRIPPDTQRSPVSVHRFHDSPTSPSHASSSPFPETRIPTPTESDEQSSKGQKAPPEQSAVHGPAPVNPADLDLPKVLLEPPDGSVRTQYVWVPLLSPLSLSSGSVSGFWCHRDVPSPVQAFKEFLRQHRWPAQGGQMVVGGGQGLSGEAQQNPPSSSNPVYNSGNQTYDQVMRERHMLHEQIAARIRAGTQLPPLIRQPHVGGGYSGTGR